MTDDVESLLAWLFIALFSCAVRWAYAGAVQWQ